MSAICLIYKLEREGHREPIQSMLFEKLWGTAKHGWDHATSAVIICYGSEFVWFVTTLVAELHLGRGSDQ